MYEMEKKDFHKDIEESYKMIDLQTQEYPINFPGLEGKEIIKVFENNNGLKIIETDENISYFYGIVNYENKKCKGVKKQVIKNKITFDDYKTVCFRKKSK